MRADAQADAPNARGPALGGADAGIDIVIVNWNSGDWLRRCLASIAADGAGCVRKVTVVDNGSVDGSDQVACPSIPLQVVRTGANLGFGRACNIGAATGRSPYLLFLNPDAALLPDTLETVLAFMEAPANAGVGACGVKLLESDGSIQQHCAHRPTASMFISMAVGLSALLPLIGPDMHDRRRDYEKSAPVDHVIGAFYLVRRTLFETLGGFDERFFVYLEDLDLSTRIHAAGFSIQYLANATALHHGGGTSDQVKPQRLAYSLESRIIYAFRHFETSQALLVAMATLLIEPFPRLIRGMARGSWTEIVDTLRGFGILWRRLYARANPVPDPGHKVATAPPSGRDR